MLEDSSGAWVEAEGKDHSRSTVPLKIVAYHHDNTNKIGSLRWGEGRGKRASRRPMKSTGASYAEQKEI